MSTAMADILTRILEERGARLAELGPELGEAVPPERAVPVVSGLSAGLQADPQKGIQAGTGAGPQADGRSVRLPGAPALFEIKRRSPSRGDIADGVDPVAQAERYHAHGARAFSVLTESAYFGGSLEDLAAVKARFPECCVLRKDFLQELDEVEVSYRAGADLVLLIAAALSAEELSALLRAVQAHGLEALVEIHDRADLEKVRPLAPRLVGINSRDLRSFRVDPLAPVALAAEINWPCALVYESGVGGYEEALFAASCGFGGVLVGEAAMRRPEIVGEVLAGRADAVAGQTHRSACLGNPRFWAELMARRTRPRRARPGRETGRPLVKICGIVHPEDGRLAAELGADLLGFVFAESPRRADPRVVAELGGLDCLKVAVVQAGPDGLDPEVCRLLRAGHLDAVQFHGDEGPEDCLPRGYPYYKAVRVRDSAALEAADAYRSPRILIDAFDAERAGGTGKRIRRELVEEAAERRPLWLAGGLNPENIGEIVRRHRPELVDASSGLESEAGRKDPAKLRRYMEEMQHAVTL